jgi:hypothetical protein
MTRNKASVILMGRKKTIRNHWQDLESNWITRHSRIRSFRDKWIWLEFHFGRGKGFWNSEIDYVKTIALIIIAAGLYAPMAWMLEPFWIGVLVIGLFLFFITWSQVMDITKYQEAQTSFSDKRTWFIREYVIPNKAWQKQMDKKIARIERDLARIKWQD